MAKQEEITERRRMARNLNPTPEARVAMIIWGTDYAAQGGGSMDFWDAITPDQRRRCKMVVETLSHKPPSGGSSDG